MYKIRFCKHFFLFYGDRAISCRRIFFADSIVPAHIKLSLLSVFCVTVIYRKILVGCRRHNVAAILHQAINNTNCVFFPRQMLHIANLFVLTNG